MSIELDWAVDRVDTVVPAYIQCQVNGEPYVAFAYINLAQQAVILTDDLPDGVDSTEFKSAVMASIRKRLTVDFDIEVPQEAIDGFQKVRNEKYGV